MRIVVQQLNQPDCFNQTSATVLSLACRRRHCALAPVLNSQSVQFQCVLVWVYSQQQIEISWLQNFSLNKKGLKTRSKISEKSRENVEG